MKKGFHKHQCGVCHCIFEHSDNCNNIKNAHNCPRCGAWHIRNFYKLDYDNTRSAQYTGVCDSGVPQILKVKTASFGH